MPSPLMWPALLRSNSNCHVRWNVWLRGHTLSMNKYGHLSCMPGMAPRGLRSLRNGKWIFTHVFLLCTHTTEATISRNNFVMRNERKNTMRKEIRRRDKTKTDNDNDDDDDDVERPNYSNWIFNTRKRCALCSVMFTKNHDDDDDHILYWPFNVAVAVVRWFAFGPNMCRLARRS